MRVFLGVSGTAKFEVEDLLLVGLEWTAFPAFQAADDLAQKARWHTAG